MKFLAEGRAKQLAEHSNFPHAGVYDLQALAAPASFYVLA